MRIFATWQALRREIGRRVVDVARSRGGRGSSARRTTDAHVSRRPRRVSSPPRGAALVARARFAGRPPADATRRVARTVESDAPSRFKLHRPERHARPPRARRDRDPGAPPRRVRPGNRRRARRSPRRARRRPSARVSRRVARPPLVASPHARVSTIATRRGARLVPTATGDAEGASSSSSSSSATTASSDDDVDALAARLETLKAKSRDMLAEAESLERAAADDDESSGTVIRKGLVPNRAEGAGQDADQGADPVPDAPAKAVNFVATTVTVASLIAAGGAYAAGATSLLASEPILASDPPPRSPPSNSSTSSRPSSRSSRSARRRRRRRRRRTRPSPSQRR